MLDPLFLERSECSNSDHCMERISTFPLRGNSRVEMPYTSAACRPGPLPFVGIHLSLLFLTMLIRFQRTLRLSHVRWAD
jgi:hypothetical protein